MNSKKTSNMPIKVANIILDGRFGGPQNRILQVAERLKKYGIETIVIIPKKDSEFFYSKLVEKNISVKRLSLHRLTKHKPHLIKWFLFFIPELVSLYEYLKKENIRLVHCNNAWQIKGILAGKMARANIILHLQDTWTPWMKKMLFNILARFFCDGFIVAGDKVRQCYLNDKWIEAKKAIEIQAPVDTSYFNPNHTVKDNIIGNMPGIKITTVGNINPDKGLEYFIEMAEILNKEYKNLHFYIIGAFLESQKKYLEKLKRMILGYNLKNIIFYGRSDNIPSVLKAADIFVCTSIREASPMAVWEAMAMEKAIVSTDVGDVKRFIKDGENGFVVPPRDAKALAEKVSILIENENLRVKFGKLARAVAVKELDVDICVEKHRRFYLEILGANV